MISNPMCYVFESALRAAAARDLYRLTVFLQMILDPACLSNICVRFLNACVAHSTFFSVSAAVNFLRLVLIRERKLLLCKRRLLF